MQKDSLKEMDICVLAKTLSLLNKDEDLHAQVSKPYKNSLKAFVEEIKFVSGLNKSEVYSLLDVKAP